MKPGSNTLFWALSGAVIFGVILFFALRFELGHPRSERLAREAKKVELADQMRVALATASEAEKSAVLAVTDEDSNAFADQARAATATVEKARAALSELLRTGGTAREKDSLTQFSSAFSEFQHVDKELLDLAVKNTNIKASALAFGPAAEAIREMDGALSRLLEQTAKSTAANAKQSLLLLAGAQAAALRIQALLPPHIAEESDPKMDALEGRMAKEDQQVQQDLKALAALVPAGNADLKLATSSYARFSDLKTQILKLSRENTNVRSLSISLNQKRKVTVLCQDALASLTKAIEEERTGTPANAPVSPR